MMFTKRGTRVPEEAAALAEAGHPGVVELVDASGDVLRTRMVDGRALAAMGTIPAAEVAGVAAAVAATLADLHDLGIVHGGIDASHILVASDGRPLLCSLGRGGDPADDVAALGRLVSDLVAKAPPEHRGRRRPRRPGHRRRLGPMLAPPVAPALTALAEKAMAAEPADRPTARAFADAVRQRIPAARLPGVTLPRPPERRALSALVRFAGKKGRIATDSAGKAADLRPSDSSSTFAMPDRVHRFGRNNRRIATDSAAKADLRQHDTGPAFPMRDRVRRSGETQGSLRRSRSPAVAAVAGGVAGMVGVGGVLVGITLAGAWALSRQGDPADVSTATETRVEPRASSGARGCSPACSSKDPSTPMTPHRSLPPEPLPATGPSSTPATTAPMATRVWPAEPLDVQDGVLKYRGSRYELGDPGDSVVAGDWACTGEPSLALLRRNAGEIFAFGGWPDNERAITARPVGQVKGAVGLRVVDVDGDGCHELEVEREAAPPVRLRVRS